MVSVYRRFQSDVEMIHHPTLLVVFLRHNERYLHLTWLTSSSTIYVYIQSTYAPKEQLPMHLCKKIREDLIVNPPQLCSGHCFLQMPVPNDGQNHN